MQGDGYGKKDYYKKYDYKKVSSSRRQKQLWSVQRSILTV